VVGVPKQLFIKKFPEDLHRALKVEAAMQGVTIQELVTRYIEEGLKRNKGKKKGG
jgi:predicted HicB family RNase H-like nuclease